MIKWCRNCKRNVEAEMKQHPTLADKVLTCPHCDGTLLYPAFVSVKRALVVAALVLLSPTLAGAEGLKIPAMVFAAGAAADIKTTHTYLTKFGPYGAKELNPTVGWCDDSPTKMLAIGAAMETAAAWGLHKWLGEKHPRLEKNLLYAVGGFHFAMAMRNSKLDGRFPEANR